MNYSSSHSSQGSSGPLSALVKKLAALPGLGPRSARRVALQLMMKKDGALLPLIAALQDAYDTITTCPTCGMLDDVAPCRICQDKSRDSGAICVVAGVADVWAIERAGGFRGTYHVLGGVLSALDGVNPADLSLIQLQRRVAADHPKEIILALPATVDGQATAHVVMDSLAEFPVKTSRLAHGMPVGGELDYLDDGTILTAFRQRVS